MGYTSYPSNVLQRSLSMKRQLTIAVLIVVLLLSAGFAQAEIGVTDACQDQVDELLDKLNSDKDEYTAESRAKAKKHLVAAKANRVEPQKCRENLMKARKALKKGKWDKR